MIGIFLYIVFAVPPWLSRSTVSAVAVDRSGVIRVSWTAPVVPTGELPLIGYSIQYHMNTGSGVIAYQNMSILQSSADVTSLFLGTEYRFYVGVVNAIGLRGYCCMGTPLTVRTHDGKFNMLIDFRKVL